MKAAFYQSKGTFTVENIPAAPPAKGEVQVRIGYCGICGTDLHVFHGDMDARVKPPSIIGHECSGVVTALGEGVQGFRIGDRVAVRPLWPDDTCPACLDGLSHICYNLKFMGVDTPGAFQEYWNVPDFTVHYLPKGLSMKLGAVVEPLAVACHDVRRSGVKAGDTAVIIGGGPIGMLVAMVAKEKGVNVVISEISQPRVEFAKSMGIEAVNSGEVDLVACIEEKTGGKGADVVFEVSGSTPGAEMMTKLVKARGTIVVVAIFAHKPPVDLHRFFWRELTMLGARVYERQDFDEALDIAAKGTMPLDRIVTKVAPLDEIESAFAGTGTNPVDMKTLIEVGGEL